MATWQFDIHLLPSEGVLRRYKAMPMMISQSDFNEECWWEGLATPQVLETGFSKILPGLQPWSRNIKQWGYDDGNRVDMVWDEGTVSDVFVRIDVRDVSYVFIANVLAIARQNACLVRTEDGQVFQPSFAKLLSATRASNAFRFVQDPQAFLEALGKARESERKDGAAES